MPRYYRRALGRYKPPPERECGRLQLDSLSLADLKKIQKSLRNYRTRCDQVRAKNSEVEAANEEIERQNSGSAAAKSAWINANVGPLAVAIRELERQLNSCAIGGLRSLFEDRFDYRFTRIADDFPRRDPFQRERADRFDYVFNGWDELTVTLTLREAPGRQIAQQHDQLYRTLCETRKRCPQFPATRDRLRLLDCPSSIVSLLIGGTRVRIDLLDLSVDEIGEQISRRLCDAAAQAQVRAKRIHAIKARAATKETEVRRLARQVGVDIHNQLAIVPACPYCEGGLTDTGAHLDHIYPVSKGGLSVEENLIFVCAPCNSKKSNLTLRRFIETFGLNQEVVHRRLAQLRKDF